MHSLLLTQLLMSTLLALTTATPLWRLRHMTQQLMAELPHHASRSPQQQKSTPMLYHPSSYLDVRPNAVVLSLTTAEDEQARYFFMPVGKNVLTHTTPELPRHVLTAHVVGAVDSDGRVVQPQDLQGAECAIYPSYDRTAKREKRVRDFAVRLSHEDGVVDLETSGQPFWLGGREVASYECW